MTQAAKVYGGSLYDLAAEEKLAGQLSLIHISEPTRPY